MTLETFFQKFDLFADAPDAVVRMRELVLELAVRGQLSERLPEDQEDPTWRMFIKSFDGRICASDPCPPPPFDFPDGWRWVCIDDVADACGQKKPDKAFTYIDVGSIDNLRGLVKSELEVLAPENAPSRARKLVRLGTVIYATVRPYLKNIAVIDRVFSPPAIISTAFAVLHPKPFTDGRFLFYWLRSKSFEAEVAARMKGVAYPAVNDREFRGCPIPLPPLAEQKRIVAKVDWLMALCDQLEAQQYERQSRERGIVRASLARFAEAPTASNLHCLFRDSVPIPPTDLRKSILTLAVQGKLVPQDPNDEPAAKLLAQTSREKHLLVAQKKIRQFETAAPIEKEELTFDVPAGWEWARLSMITRRIHYGYTASAKAEIKGVRLLRITDIQDNTVDWDSVPGCEIARDDVSQYQLERGDILVARTGGTVGKTYLVRDVPIVTVFASYLIRIQGATALFDRYLKLFLESPTYWVQLEEGARGAAQPNVNGQTLGRMVVSVPPLAEQHRIVAKVDELMALVDTLETQLATARYTAANLLAAAVAELTGTPTNGKVSAPPAHRTGRRGRPRKSPN